MDLKLPRHLLKKKTETKSMYWLINSCITKHPLILSNPYVQRFFPLETKISWKTSRYLDIDMEDISIYGIEMQIQFSERVLSPVVLSGPEAETDRETSCFRLITTCNMGSAQLSTDSLNHVKRRCLE